MAGKERWDALQRRVVRQLEEVWPAVGKLDTVRQRVVLDMVFNLGVKGLLAMRRFVAAVEFHFWETAAEEMLNSQWAEQHKRRARALAEMMRTGLDEALPVR
jgi:lysozyme